MPPDRRGREGARQGGGAESKDGGKGEEGGMSDDLRSKKTNI